MAVWNLISEDKSKKGCVNAVFGEALVSQYHGLLLPKAFCEHRNSRVRSVELLLFVRGHLIEKAVGRELHKRNLNKMS
jgi:hypothetical protein